MKSIALTLIEESPKLIDPKIVTDPISPVVDFFKGVASKLITQFLNDYKAKVSKGEVKKPEDFKTEEPVLTLAELLKVLAQELPDKERFKALKSIFFTSIAKGASEEDEMLAYEFIQTAKKLSGIEILILKANYEIAEEGLGDTNSMAFQNRDTWRREITKKMGDEKYKALVRKYERNLEDLGLISPRGEMDRLQNNFEATHHFRLTEIGKKFCEFITEF